MKKSLIYLQQREDTTLKKHFFMLIFAIITFLCCFLTLKEQDVYVTYEGTKTAAFIMNIAVAIVGIFNTVAIHPTEKTYVLPMIANNHISAQIYLRCILIQQIILGMLESLVALLFFSFFSLDEVRRTGILMPVAAIEMYLSFFLLIISCSALGFLVGLFVQDITHAMIAIPAIILVLILFSRGVLELSDVLERICEWVPTKQAMSVLGSIIDINKYPLAISLEYPDALILNANNTLFNPTKEYILAGMIKQLIIFAIFLVLIRFVYSIKYVKQK